MMSTQNKWHGTNDTSKISTVAVLAGCGTRTSFYSARSTPACTCVYEAGEVENNALDRFPSNSRAYRTLAQLISNPYWKEHLKT